VGRALWQASAVPGLPFDPIAEARRQWLERWGPAPVSSMSAVTSIMRVQQILMARLNAILKPFGLTFPRYEALMLLHFSRRGALPLGKIGGRLQVHPTSVTNLIDGLERSGYVRREPHEHDRRTTLAVITPAGRRTAEEATLLLNGARFGTAPLGAPDLERIGELLRALRAAEDEFPLG
jgi:DNA-binding MarR family transcriptional regulator